jgi:hypothetical protein
MSYTIRVFRNDGSLFLCIWEQDASQAFRRARGVRDRCTYEPYIQDPCGKIYNLAEFASTLETRVHRMSA